VHKAAKPQPKGNHEIDKIDEKGWPANHTNDANKESVIRVIGVIRGLKKILAAMRYSSQIANVAILS
jgi:hypothetical protein